MKWVIAIDCMGGDRGVSATVPAAVNFLQRNPDTHCILVGQESLLKSVLTALKALDHPRLSLVHASEVITMEDSVELALRKKKDSSMRCALDLVKEAKAQACVSSGNTGALMAVSRYLLKTLSGIDRPAIASTFPNRLGKSTTVLDLGANVDCTPHNFLQFAEMGHALVFAVDNNPRPSIGLLNIGGEVIKGNEQIKQAGELLRTSAINFYGNVEGNDIYKGTVDIVVCDGFVGNVLLKTAEGLAQMLREMMGEEFRCSLYSRTAALISAPILKRFRNRLDHRRYNGAALLGLKELVFKSHGGADAYAFEWAIQRCFNALKNGVQEKLIDAMEQDKARLTHAQVAEDCALKG